MKRNRFYFDPNGPKGVDSSEQAPVEGGDSDGLNAGSGDEASVTEGAAVAQES